MSSEVSFTQILGDLSTKDGIDREFLHSIILSVPNVSEIVDAIFETISKTSNDNRKIDLFNLLLDYLLQHPLDDSYDDTKTSKVIENLASFSVIIKEHQPYVKLNDVLQQSFEKLSAQTKEQFVQIVPSQVPYGSFVFCSFSVKNTIHTQQIFSAPPSSIPYLEGIVLLLRSHKATELSEEDAQVIKDNVNPKFVSSLLSALTDNTKSYGIAILEALLNFDPETAKTIIPTLDQLNANLRKNNFDLRRNVLEFYTSLPTDDPLLDGEDKLTKTLTVLCNIVDDPEDPILPYIEKFGETRKSIDYFPGILQKLAAADQTVTGAVFVALELGLITPEFLEVAFPNNVKPPRANISVNIAKKLLGNKKCTDAIYCALLNQEITSFQSDPIIKKQEFRDNSISAIPKFVEVYPQFGASFSLTTLNRITEITQPEVLKALADEGAKLKDVKAPDVEDELLFKGFAHLFQNVLPLADVQNIYSFFAQLPDKEEPDSPSTLLNKCIPAAKINEFITFAESNLKQMPRLAILCVSVEGLDDAKLDELLKFISQDDVFNQNLGVQFFTAMNIHYSDYFMKTIDKEAYGKQVTTNIIVPRKKRVRINETCRSLFVTLPRVLKDKELSPEQQTQLISILYNTIPHQSFDDFAEDSKRLRPCFTLIKDVDPNEEQYTFFLSHGFIRECPYLLRSVKGTPELSQSLMTQYADEVKFFHYEPENIEAVSQTLFRLSPTEDALFFAMELVRKNIQPKENALKFAEYAKCFAKAAHDNKIHVTQPRFAPFLVKYIIYTTCKQPEFREVSFEAFSYLFDVEPVTDVGKGLTQEQVNEQALTLFTRIAPKLTPEFINEFLYVTHKKRYYTTSTGLFIRSLFDTRDDMATIDVYGKAVMRLLKIQPSMPPLNQFHLEKGFLSFAKRNMNEFLPLFLSSESPYLEKLVNRILASPEHRLLFIKGLCHLINTTQKVPESLILFDNLKRVVTTEETNELCVVSFASLTAEVLMWAATIYQLRPQLNLIQINNEQSAMSDVFNLITTKSTIASKSNVNFDTSDPITLNTSITQVASSLVDADIERLTASMEYINKMLESPKQTFVLAATLFFIQFAAVYSQYDNKDTTELIKGLYSSIAKGTQTANMDNRRIIALALFRAFGDDHYQRFTTDDVSLVYNRILDSAENHDTKIYENETILSLCKLAPYCQAEQRHGRRLLALIRKGVDTYEFNKAYFIGINSYLDVKNDLQSFTAEDLTTNLTLQGFFKNYSKYPEDITAILKKLAESDDIVSGLKGKVDPNYLANCGSVLLGQYKVYPEEVYDLLSAIAISSEESQEQPAKQYRTDFTLVSLPIAEDKTNPLSQKAIESVKALIH